MTETIHSLARGDSIERAEDGGWDLKYYGHTYGHVADTPEAFENLRRVSLHFHRHRELQSEEAMAKARGAAALAAEKGEERRREACFLEWAEREALGAGSSTDDPTLLLPEVVEPVPPDENGGISERRRGVLDGLLRTHAEFGTPEEWRYLLRGLSVLIDEAEGRRLR